MRTCLNLIVRSKKHLLLAFWQKTPRKQAILIGLLLDLAVIKSLISIGDFVKLAYASCKKSATQGAFLMQVVNLYYRTCTDAVLVVPLGTSAPETMTTTSPFSA